MADEQEQDPTVSFEPLYFGCWGSVGHYLHDRDGCTHWRASLAVDGRHLDGGFWPACRRHRESYMCNDGCQPQGLARLTHLPDCTVLNFFDRTVDRRGGSHSLFVLPPGLDLDGAVAAARDAFPAVWRHLDAASVVVRLVP